MHIKQIDIQIQGNMEKSMTNRNKRQSNFEALRIMAMFLVLVVHADYYSLGAPSLSDVQEFPLSSFIRMFIESLSIVCVNVFVLISGWFGIHPKVKSFSNFVFQCLFFSIGIYIFCLLSGYSELSLQNIAECFYLTGWGWFIKSYICLYILSPVLNAFTETASNKQIKFFILFFYIFQTIYSWITDAAVFFENGYSTVSFIGLYILARYVRFNKTKIFSCSVKTDFAVYIVSSLLIAICAFLPYIIIICLNVDNHKLISVADIISNRIYLYNNPLVIISSLYLLLGFSKFRFTNRIVNRIGASCFAVFLFHTNPNLCDTYFKPIIQTINDWGGYGIMSLISIGLFLVLVFVVAVILDQIRILCWKVMLSVRYKKDNLHIE